MPKGLELDGVSLVPLLEGRQADWPERMIFTHWTGAGKVLPTRGSVRSGGYRAVVRGKSWELYDMVADPAQSKNIAKQHPKLVGRFRAAYETWFDEVTRSGFEPLPAPVGHTQRPLVILPGHEAFLHPRAGEGISYVGRAGWANDWVTNWTSTDAYPWWEIEVVRPGRYQVTLMYSCPASDIGSRLRVQIGPSSIEGVVGKAHDPAPIHGPNRVAAIEVPEKVWAPLALGCVELPKGRMRLSVKALAVAGRKVMDLKAVHLRRVDWVGTVRQARPLCEDRGCPLF